MSSTADPGQRVAPAPGYPSDLERVVRRADGLTFTVRPIIPDDTDRLVAFHRHLSAHSVYLRFFSFHPTLSETEVRRFTMVDYVDRLALVAAIGEQLIAVGRFDRSPGTAEAEVAFVVADEFQHHGIGSLLLDELAKAAWARGIETLTAQTLAENRTMLDVFRHSGFPVSTTIEYGTVVLRFPIEPTATSAAALAQREMTRCRPAGTGPTP